jgi:polysaccharide export outer membrane protein
MPEVKGYLVGPGDKLEGKVLGEPEFDFTAIIDDTGSFKLPYVDEPVSARCRTESDIRTDVKNLLSKYLKDPLVSVQVTERRTPVPVTIIGEVRNPQKVDLRRSATLVELLAFAGGVKEDSAKGSVKVFRTQPPMCGDDSSDDNWVAAENSISGLPSRSYNTEGVSETQDESNPTIYPGDLIIVEKAAPVYIIGEVNALRSISITQGGLTLSEAIAQAGGFRERAKKKEITIRRLKPGTKEREVIQVNYNLIADGSQKDFMLKAEDIVIVDKSPKSIGQTILEIATGSVKTFANTLPMTVLY